MEVIDIVQLLPKTVQPDTLEFLNCKSKDGRNVTRVTLSRLLTEEEKSEMHGEHFVGINCIAHYRYAPEIEKSYLYVV